LARRFALLATLLVTAVLVVSGVALFVSYTGLVHRQLDTRLSQTATTVAANAGAAGRVTTAEGQSAGPVGIVLGRQRGQTVALSPAAARGAPVVADALWSQAMAAPGTPVLATISSGGVAYRVALLGLTAPITGPGGREGVTALAFAESTADTDAEVRSLGVLLLPLGVAAILLAALGGAWVGRRAVAPLHGLVEAVDAVGMGDLGVRVAVPRSGDEVERLALSFNRSLARIDEGYASLQLLLSKQRRFVNDASHELRTPLTTISSCIELLHRVDAIPPDQRARLLDDAMHEARVMSELLDDLLLLARHDAGERPALKPLVWPELVNQMAELTRTRCAPRAFTLELDPGLTAGTGDAAGLLKVMENLAGNVAAHTPEDCSVTLTARVSEGGVLLQLCDTGPGVPADSVDQLFDRFMQLDAARTEGGSGLGLSVAAALVENHGGTITARNQEPHGLCVTARIPQ
jgi:signal transduction histidine kinase